MTVRLPWASKHGAIRIDDRTRSGRRQRARARNRLAADRSSGGPQPRRGGAALRSLRRRCARPAAGADASARQTPLRERLAHQQALRAQTCPESVQTGT